MCSSSFLSVTAVFNAFFFFAFVCAGKWVFTGCIIFSFLLLLWEARKSRAIIKSRDISYAFTNVVCCRSTPITTRVRQLIVFLFSQMSQDYYSLRSYDHFCFFSQINNSKKKKDEFAFFIFFTFKGYISSSYPSVFYTS